MKIVNAIPVAIGLISLSVNAASFDCTRAGTVIAKQICANEQLSELDEKVSALFQSLLAGLNDEDQKSAVKKDHSNWISKLTKCSDAACLESTYRSRIVKICSYPDLNLNRDCSTSSQDSKSSLSITPQSFKKFDKQAISQWSNQEKSDNFLDLLESIPSDRYERDVKDAFLIKELYKNIIVFLDSNKTKHYVVLSKFLPSSNLMVWYIATHNECREVLITDVGEIMNKFYQWWFWIYNQPNAMRIGEKLYFDEPVNIYISASISNFNTSHSEYSQKNYTDWLNGSHKTGTETFDFVTFIKNLNKHYPSVITSSDHAKYLVNQKKDSLKDVESLLLLSDIATTKKNHIKFSSANFFKIGNDSQIISFGDTIFPILGTTRTIFDYERFGLPGPTIISDVDPEEICLPKLKSTISRRLDAISYFVKNEASIRDKINQKEQEKKAEQTRVHNERLSQAKRLYFKYNGNGDIVRKVLNYSTTCKEDGFFEEDKGGITSMSFWYPYKDQKCVYAFYRKYRDHNAPPVEPPERIIDLNTIDPRNFTVTHKKGSDWFSIEVKLDNEVFDILYPFSCITDRIERGWSRVFSEFCAGNIKDF